MALTDKQIINLPVIPCDANFAANIKELRQDVILAERPEWYFSSKRPINQPVVGAFEVVILRTSSLGFDMRNIPYEELEKWTYKVDNPLSLRNDEEYLPVTEEVFAVDGYPSIVQFFKNGQHQMTFMIFYE